ncbi:MAG: methylenetetrahydrofolate reductase [Candidatus Cloacimonetes bacterium]|nr:methylenetetrahydrofolate reductase [Candidatus Cloacimonadota bacterium]
MKITDYIKNGKKFFSLEVSPPTKNKSITPLFKTIERFLPYKPAYISITYHPLKITQIKIDTILTNYFQKKHCHPLGICAAIKYKYNIEVMPHFVCAGMTKVQVEEALLDFSFLEFENIFALRGDPAIANEQFQPIDGGYYFANELVLQLKAMKQSLFLNLSEGFQPVDFCVGVAGYPEKHRDALDIEDDIKNLLRKVRSGADFIITQMCFDADVLIQWVKKIRSYGIDVPVIPGIKPLTSINQLETLKYEYKINIPETLEKKLRSYSDKKSVYQYGIEHCIDLSMNLLNSGFSGIHYFTMGNGNDIEDVVKKITL